MSGAYPDGCTAADVPGCDPEPHCVDADLAYDLVRQRIDDGLECPTCHRANIKRTTALGLPLFICRACDTSWYDSLTQPATEIAA